MAWIYVIKNNINDKLYVGQTGVGIDERFKRHIWDALHESECAIHRAMRKHGVEHFWPELIEETDNPNEREIYWIKKLGTYEYGYNETRGGEGVVLHDRGYIIETYKRIGTVIGAAKELGINASTVRTIVHSLNIHVPAKTTQVMMRDMNLIEMKMFNDLAEAAEYILKEGKTKVSLSSIKVVIGNCCRGKAKTAYGYIFEYVKNCEENGFPAKRTFREIIQSDLDGNFIAKYNSCGEAAKAVGGTRADIRMCCISLKKTYKNYKWSYGDEINCPEFRSVFQIEKLTGKVIKKWDSITAAANALRISNGHIGNVCNGRKKSAGGFIWRYADEMELAA